MNQTNQKHQPQIQQLLSQIMVSQDSLNEKVHDTLQEIYQVEPIHPLIYLYQKNQLSHELKTQSTKNPQFLIDLYFAVCYEPKTTNQLLKQISYIIHQNQISKDEWMVIPYLEFKKIIQILLIHFSHSNRQIIIENEFRKLEKIKNFSLQSQCQFISKMQELKYLNESVKNIFQFLDTSNQNSVNSQQLLELLETNKTDEQIKHINWQIALKDNITIQFEELQQKIINHFLNNYQLQK